MTPNLDVILQTYREQLSTIEHWYGSDRVGINPDEETILINQSTYFFLLLLETVEYEIQIPSDILSQAIQIFQNISHLRNLNEQAEELCVCIMGLLFQYYCKLGKYESDELKLLYNHLLQRISPTQNSLVITLRAFHYLIKGIPHDRDCFHHFVLEQAQMAEFYGTLEILVKIHSPKILADLTSSSSFFGFGTSGSNTNNNTITTTGTTTTTNSTINPNNNNYNKNNHGSRHYDKNNILQQSTNGQCQLPPDQPPPRPFDPLLQRVSIFRYIAEYLDILCCYCAQDNNYSYHFPRWFGLLVKINNVLMKVLENRPKSRLVWEALTQLLLTFNSFFKTTFLFFVPIITSNSTNPPPTPGLNYSSTPSFSTHKNSNNAQLTPFINSGSTGSNNNASTISENDGDNIEKATHIYNVVMTQLTSETFLPALFGLIPALDGQQTKQSHQGINNIIEILIIAIENDTKNSQKVTEFLISSNSLKILSKFLYNINELHQPNGYNSLDYPIDLSRVFNLIENIYIKHNTVSKYIKINNLFEEYGIIQHIYRFVQLFLTFLQSTPKKRRCSVTSSTTTISTTSSSSSPLSSSISLLSPHDPEVTSVKDYLDKKQYQNGFEAYISHLARSLCPLVTSLSSIHHLVCHHPCQDSECEWYYRLDNNPTLQNTHGSFNTEVLRLQVDNFHRKQYHRHLFVPLINICVGAKMTSGIVQLLHGVLDIVGLCSQLLERPQEIPGGYNSNDIFTLYHDIYQQTLSAFCLYYPEPNNNNPNNSIKNDNNNNNNNNTNDNNTSSFSPGSHLSPQQQKVQQEGILSLLPVPPTPTRPVSSDLHNIQSINDNNVIADKPALSQSLSGSNLSYKSLEADRTSVRDNDITTTAQNNKNTISTTKTVNVINQWYKQFDPLSEQDPLAYLTYVSFFHGYQSILNHDEKIANFINTNNILANLPMNFTPQNTSTSYGTIGSTIYSQDNSYSLISSNFSTDTGGFQYSNANDSDILATPIRSSSHQNRTVNAGNSKRSTSQPPRSTMGNLPQPTDEIVVNNFDQKNSNNEGDHENNISNDETILNPPVPLEATQLTLKTLHHDDDFENVSYTYASETPDCPITPFELTPNSQNNHTNNKGNTNHNVYTTSPSITPTTTHHPNLRTFYGLSVNFYRAQQVLVIIHAIAVITRKFKRIVKNYPTLTLKPIIDHSTFVQLYKDEQYRREIDSRTRNKYAPRTNMQPNSNNGQNGNSPNSNNLLTTILGPDNTIAQWYNSLTSDSRQIVNIAAMVVPIVTATVWLWWKTPQKTQYDYDKQLKRDSLTVSATRMDISGGDEDIPQVNHLLSSDLDDIDSVSSTSHHALVSEDMIPSSQEEIISINTHDTYQVELIDVNKIENIDQDEINTQQTTFIQPEQQSEEQLEQQQPEQQLEQQQSAHDHSSDEWEMIENSIYIPQLDYSHHPNDHNDQCIVDPISDEDILSIDEQTYHQYQLDKFEEKFDEMINFEGKVHSDEQIYDKLEQIEELESYIPAIGSIPKQLLADQKEILHHTIEIVEDANPHSLHIGHHHHHHEEEEEQHDHHHNDYTVVDQNDGENCIFDANPSPYLAPNDDPKVDFNQIDAYYNRAGPHNLGQVYNENNDSV